MSQIHCLIHWYLFFSVIMKEFMITRSSIVEMKNFVVNPQSRPIKSNSEYIFLFKYVSSKIQRQKFSKYRKNPYFGHTFAQRELFLETLAMYNYRNIPAFKCQRYRVDWLSNQKLFHHYQHAKMIHSVCSIYQIICEKNLI